MVFRRKYSGIRYRSSLKYWGVAPNPNRFSWHGAQRIWVELDNCHIADYIYPMIESIRHKGLKRFFTKGDVSKLPAEQVSKIRDILARLNVAETAQDMSFEGSGFHQLTGDLKDFYSVKVTGNYRIIFQFSEGNAYKVDYVDYH